MADTPDSSEATALRAPWRQWLTGRMAAVVVLAVFWIFMLASLRDKSLTSDELGHAVAGYTYWKYNDYRLDPENGILPQRIMGLALVTGQYRAPPRDSDLWHGSEQWLLGDLWFHHLGNDIGSMLRRGRAAMGLVAVALGALVWWMARRLFGATAGLLALVLYVASPSILANGALMTSDTTCSFFLLAAALALWAVLQRITVLRLLLSGIAMGGLFASKASAVLIIPVGVLLLLLRVGRGDPLRAGFRTERLIGRARAKAAALVGVVLAHAVIVWAVIWACYGFRYSAFAAPVTANDRLQFSWDFVLDQPGPSDLLAQVSLTPAQQERAGEILARYNLRQDGSIALDAVERSVLTPAQRDRLDVLRARPPAGLLPRMVGVARQYRLFPEAYLYGWADAWRFSQRRAAFWNGDYRVYGWRLFFPYTFAVKTPIAVFGILCFAIGAVVVKARDRIGGMTPRQYWWNGFYATAPLWTLLGCYWAAAMATHLNIGHRHILPTYAPMFVLCGAAAWWFDRGRHSAGGDLAPSTADATRSIAPAVVIVALLAALLVEIVYRFPNYLPYFNGIVSPANGWRHLTDSSVDWGQDLPGVKKYLDAHPTSRPAYLSYAGTASPASYGINARLLYCAVGFDEPRTPIRTVRASLDALPAKIAAARQAWPDCAILGQTRAADGIVTVYFLRVPVVSPLRGGTYFISATMLSTTPFGSDGPMGPWNTRFENTYQELSRQIAPLMASDPSIQAQAVLAMPLTRWAEIFELYSEYQFARLAAFLRQRQPDDEIGYSILVYKLSDDDAHRALLGPPPELGVDVPTQLARGER